MARLEDLERKFEENPRRYFAPLANEYRKAGDPQRAVELCRAQLPEVPGHISGHIVLGQALFDARDFTAARGALETALALDPENIVALRYLGDIARELGDSADAERWYTRTLEADPYNEAATAALEAVRGSAVRADAQATSAAESAEPAATRANVAEGFEPTSYAGPMDESIPAVPTPMADVASSESGAVEQEAATSARVADAVSSESPGVEREAPTSAPAADVVSSGAPNVDQEALTAASVADVLPSEASVVEQDEPIPAPIEEVTSDEFSGDLEISAAAERGPDEDPDDAVSESEITARSAASSTGFVAERDSWKPVEELVANAAPLTSAIDSSAEFIAEADALEPVEDLAADAAPSTSAQGLSGEPQWPAPFQDVAAEVPFSAHPEDFAVQPEFASRSKDFDRGPQLARSSPGSETSGSSAPHEDIAAETSSSADSDGTISQTDTAESVLSSDEFSAEPVAGEQATTPQEGMAGSIDLAAVTAQSDAAAPREEQPLVPAPTEDAIEAEERVMETAAPFVTETMADLYLDQGYPHEALELLLQLSEQRPSDETLRVKIESIQATIVARRDAAVAAARSERHDAMDVAHANAEAEPHEAPFDPAVAEVDASAFEDRDVDVLGEHAAAAEFSAVEGASFIEEPGITESSAETISVREMFARMDRARPRAAGAVAAKPIARLRSDFVPMPGAEVGPPSATDDDPFAFPDAQPQATPPPESVPRSSGSHPTFNPSTAGLEDFDAWLRGLRGP